MTSNLKHCSVGPLWKYEREWGRKLQLDLDLSRDLQLQQFSKSKLNSSSNANLRARAKASVPALEGWEGRHCAVEGLRVLPGTRARHHASERAPGHDAAIPPVGFPQRREPP